MPCADHADEPPQNGSISLRYLDYADRQPGLDRIHAHSPSVSVTAPVASDWSVEGTLTADDVSGASPRYHTAISGASHMPAYIEYFAVKKIFASMAALDAQRYLEE